MKQTNANNGRYLIWVLRVFAALQLVLQPAGHILSGGPLQSAVQPAAQSGKSGSEIGQYLDRQVARLECLCLSTFLELGLQI